MIFTIAIPVYNGEASLKKTLESAIAQKASFPYEILISNNGSTDGSSEVIKSFEVNNNNIRVINRTDTVPMYENHNICLREAQGDYVVFCHADDFLLEDCLDKFYQVLQKRNFPTKYVLWGRSMFRDFYIAWKASEVGLNNILSGKESIIPFMYGGLAPSGVCYSRKSFVEVKGFSSATLRLTPFDMSSMFKLAVNGFEFEMADRLFFIRRYATTSRVLTNQLVRESVYDAMQCLRKDLDEEQFSFLVSAISESNKFFPFLSFFLVKENLISKKATRKLVVKEIMKKPRLLINRNFHDLIKGVV